MREKKLIAAKAYIARGWKVFTVSAQKIPWANCARCQTERHDPQLCPCLSCHGFYAATDNVLHVQAMLWSRDEDAQLALRTGSASGFLALDAEGTDNDEFGETGLDVLNSFDSWTGVALPDTLRQRTASGGVHLLYRLPTDTVVASRNRILPNLDLKSEGGYIVVGPGGGRTWLNWSVSMDQAPSGLLDWLKTSFGASGGGGNGTLVKFRAADIIPAGYRYEFTRDLTYYLARNRTLANYTYDHAEQICRQYWERYEQPKPDTRREGRIWLLPWSQVRYELRRAWQRVTPDEGLSFQQRAWIESETHGN